MTLIAFNFFEALGLTKKFDECDQVKHLFAEISGCAQFVSCFEYSIYLFFNI